MIYRPTKKMIDDYYKSEALNQSLIKLLIKGYDYYVMGKEKAKSEKFYDEPEDHFIIGNAVDCFLTRGEVEFRNEYHITTLDKKPSDSLISIIMQTLDELAKLTAERDAHNLEPFTAPYSIDTPEAKELLIKSARDHNYQSRWTDDTIYNSIVSSCTDYWYEVQKASGKQVITFDQFTKVIQIKDSILSSKQCKYFDETFEDRVHYDLFYQVPLYYNYRDYNNQTVTAVKILVDVLYIDYENKIIKIIDLKTSSFPTTSFESVMKRFRLDIQGAFYFDNIVENKSTLFQKLAETYGIPPSRYEYMLSKDINQFVFQFGFVVESTNVIGNPLYYRMSDELLEIGRKGRPGLEYDAVSYNGKFYNMFVSPVYGYEYGIEAYHNYEIHGIDQDLLLKGTNSEIELNWNNTL